MPTISHRNRHTAEAPQNAMRITYDGANLPNDDASGLHWLATKDLDTTPLRHGVTAVLGGT